MAAICGAKCEGCGFRANCGGCSETCGRPFGGGCVAAEHIRAHGAESYARFKSALLAEINALLASNGIPKSDTLFELPGFLLNLPYPLPGGGSVRFLDDKKVYLGVQIPGKGGRCFGAAADAEFILICSYGENGADAELLLYKKRARTYD